MKKVLLIFAAIMTVISCGKRENPFLREWDTPYGLPPFEEIRYEDYVPAVKAGIEQQKAEIKAILENAEEPAFENVIAAYELSGAILEKTCGVLFNLSGSDNSPEFEKILGEVVPMLTEFGDSLTMNKDFFAKVRTVYKSDQSGWTREQQMLVKKLYTDFVRNGVGLDSESQEKLSEINKELADLSLKFGNNLLAENNAFAEEFEIPVSAYEQTMSSTEDRSEREKMFRAYSSRCSRNNEFDNREIALRIFKLRAEKARLLGYENFAEYSLEDKMAGTPGRVDAFLSDIMEASMKRAKEELAEMQKIMDRDIAEGKLEAGTKIKPWDWFYYAERVRKAKYNLDDNDVRPYFKLENVRDGAFAVAGRLYGIKIEKLENMPVYHPGVGTYKVTDADGSLLGLFYTDYLPRASKRGGAWMSNFRKQYVDSEGNDVRPIIVNVCNLSEPEGNLPSLLNPTQVTTVFHEFGHALHGLLSKCNYRSISGTSVTDDFVETFSQFNENWAFLPENLNLYAKHYETGEVIPANLVEKIINTSKFNRGFITGELCAASMLDMAWHECSPEDFDGLTVEGFEEEVTGRIGLIDEIIPRYRTAYFSHILNGGYSAGYYGYLWSEVLDKCLFRHFCENGLFDNEISMKFRRTFLEKGGGEDPMKLFISFYGSEPDAKALMEAHGLI